MKDNAFIRLLDRRIGGFLCGAFSCFDRLTFRRKQVIVRRILLIELFEMGAAIMTYPSIVYLRKMYSKFLRISA